MDIESLDIAQSAHRHGINDAQIIHALRNPIRIASLNDEVSMVIGDDGSRGLIEVGMLFRHNHMVVIHAMPARAKFLR